MTLHCPRCLQPMPGYADRAAYEAEHRVLEMGLGPHQSLVFEALHRRSMSFATKQALIDAVWGDDAEGGPADGPKAIEVLICQLRKKIAPHGYRIATVWGHGYRLEKIA